MLVVNRNNPGGQGAGRGRLIGLLLTTVIACHLSLSASYAGEPYQRSRIFWDSNTYTTIFSHGSYARAIQLQDNRIMAVTGGGGIRVSYSSNSGRTWSAEQRIVSNPSNIDNCVPDLIQLADGTIIVAYNPRPSAPYSTDRKFGIRCKRSTDNGKTWSDEIFVNDAQHTFNDGCWEPSMLELPSGEVQLYFADEGPYTNSGEQQISMCRSFDGGLTWSPAQRVIFRAGTRDGMPVPILLDDGQTIVVIFEDNGWPGIPDFFPTTARCPLSVNWNDYWVSAGSPARKQTLSTDLSVRPSGGAPYLRKLPSGETVISWQSSYGNNGKLNYWFAVGNENAEDFRALSNPFGASTTVDVLWNSIAVVDTGEVLAIGGYDGRIDVIKGMPKRMFQAAYGHPKVDGRFTRNEGYFTSTATQITMGQQIGTYLGADFAYDRDSLYFYARIADRTDNVVGAQQDALLLSIDAAGLFTDLTERAQRGMYRFMLRRAGSIVAQRGENKTWRTDAATDLHFATTQTSAYYILELAIPWTQLGISSLPQLVQQQGYPRMAINIEFYNRSADSYRTETIPDANATASSTWMQFGLVPSDEATGIDAVSSPHPTSPRRGGDETVYDLQGRKISSPWGEAGGRLQPSSQKGIYIVVGPNGSRKVVY